MQNKAAKGCIRVLNDTLFPDFTCCPSSPPSSKYAVKRKKRRAYPRTSAACCAVHATLACAGGTHSLSSFNHESYRPPRTLLPSDLPPFCAFVKCGMRLLFSLEPLFSFRRRKARAQPITQHNTHTVQGQVHASANRSTRSKRDVQVQRTRDKPRRGL